MKKRFKIVFMGTPDFAVPSLKAVCQSCHDLMLVVTQPDRPKGRGRKLSQAPVKKVAIQLGCDIIQPESIRTKKFVDKIKNLEPDFFVVIAFGHIISKELLSIPKIGSINLHASLLPKYRGAAPIQWALIKGEQETGVTTIFMDKGIDTGDILLSSKIKISSDETSATLHERLAILGSSLLLSTIKKLADNDITPIRQDHAHSTYAPILKKRNGQINWDSPAKNLEAFVRGMSPWPGAFTFHGEKRLKIFNVKALAINVDEMPGTVLKSFPDELCVATGKGAVSIFEIQGASGKRLLIKDFMKGNKIEPGTFFSNP